MSLERRLSEVRVGDAVRVDDDTAPWRVEEHDPKTGLLVLESLRSMTRVRWADVHEFRVTKSRTFA